MCLVYNAHKSTSIIHGPIAFKEKLGVFHHTSPSFIITLNTFKEHSKHIDFDIHGNWSNVVHFMKNRHMWTIVLSMGNKILTNIHIIKKYMQST